MATDLYAGFSNPVAGENFRCLANTKEAFIMEWIAQPGGHVPNDHIHLLQEEIFHVHSGELVVVIDDKEQIAKAGETVVVPKGKSHRAYNNKQEAAICHVEYRPAFEMYTFFQCMGGLCSDKDYNPKSGQVNIPKLCYFMKKMKAKAATRPTKIPPPMFKVVMNLFYFIGSMKGWGKLYTKYTGAN